MDLREECKKMFDSGYPIATFAKRIGRDASTIYKWVTSERNLSPQVEEEVLIELKRMKKIWENINV